MSDTLLLFILGLVTAINGWQLHEMYRFNREVGEISTTQKQIAASLERITSDTESEKATRARVNSMILQRLGCPECDVQRVIAEIENQKPKNKQ